MRLELEAYGYRPGYEEYLELGYGIVQVMRKTEWQWATVQCVWKMKNVPKGKKNVPKNTKWGESLYEPMSLW